MRIAQLLGVVLELLSKSADIDAQILNVGLRRPQFAQDLQLRQHLAGMRGEKAQQIVFSRGKLHLVPAHGHEPPHKVDRRRAVRKSGLLSALLQPVREADADTRDHLAGDRGPAALEQAGARPVPAYRDRIPRADAAVSSVTVEHARRDCPAARVVFVGSHVDELAPRDFQRVRGLE